MSILDGFKTCRKGLHQYSVDKRQCPECHKASKKQWYKNNLEKNLEQSRRWRKENPDYDRRYYNQNVEQCRKSSQQWSQKNSDRIQKKNQLWRKKNPDYKKLWREQNLDKVQNYSRRWAEKNPDKERAKSTRRRANKKHATPPWADQAAINTIYAEAIRLEKETGIKYHVDHVYPLKSDYMCGLHVETNLQILTEKENIKKGNRTWPGQLDCQRLPLHLNGFEKIPNWSRSL